MKREALPAVMMKPKIKSVIIKPKSSFGLNDSVPLASPSLAFVENVEFIAEMLALFLIFQHKLCNFLAFIVTIKGVLCSSSVKLKLIL